MLNYLELRLTNSLLNYRDASARMPKYLESLHVGVGLSVPFERRDDLLEASGVLAVLV